MAPTEPMADDALQRELLRVALRNARRSVPALAVVVAYLAWLAAQRGLWPAAAGVGLLGMAAALWRWHAARAAANLAALDTRALAAVARSMRDNAILTGAMWVLATFAVYPALEGHVATIYVLIVAGSITMAAFFLSLVRRAFVWLVGLQLGAIALVSLIDARVHSPMVALLSVIFGAVLLAATREFRDTTLAALRQSARAEAASLAKSRFLATMSHEIRTPMSGVLGALRLLQGTALNDRQTRLVDSAAASGESLLALLNDVLDHAKIEAGKLRIDRAPLQLHALAESSLALFRANADSRGLALQLHIDAAVPAWVQGDALHLQQVLTNLIGNAVKFTDRGEVRLQIGPDKGQPDAWRFEVRDTGIGIAEEAQAAVFDAFQQADSSPRRSHGGTGLGLAISQSLVQAMGGSITLQSQPGVGSRFAFTLVLPAAPAAAGTAPAAAGRHRGPWRAPVLLVEDNAVNRLVAAEMLQAAGVEVVLAEDGAQALEQARAQYFGLVLMDLQMPVLDGLAATAAIREHEAAHGLPRVPIVALTANAFDDDRAAALAAGMDGHLAKPCSPEQLDAVLARWLR